MCSLFVSLYAVVGLLLSAMSVFSIWGVPSNHTAVVAVSCVFSAISLTVFGALEVVNTVYYDAEFRCDFYLHYNTILPY